MKKSEVPSQVAMILDRPYARRLVPDEAGGYVASIQEFPGCIAEGDTPAEAIHNLHKAATSWVEVAIGNGYEIREPVSFLGFSGKVALRLPRGLHKQVAELAELEECSVNSLLVTATAEYVSRKAAIRKLSDAVCSEMRRIVADGLVSFHRYGPAEIVITMLGAETGFFAVGTTIEGQVREKTYSPPWGITQANRPLLSNQSL